MRGTKSRWLRLSAMAVVLAAFTAMSSLGSAGDEFQLSPHSVPLDRIVSGGPAKDGIPALLEPPFLAASAATYLSDDDRVVGVHDGNIAKAYPLGILNWHEIVNDRLGQRPVVVTYCPLTASAAVFEREIGGNELRFGVSGLLYESNVLFYDRQTESLWSQLKQEAVTGAKTGVALIPVPAVETTWSRWRAKHPDTLVLSPRTGHRRDYERSPYARYDASPGTMFPTSSPDQRLAAKERVLSVAIDGVARAYPLKRLAELGQPLHDRLGNVNLQIQYDHPTRTAEAFAGGQPFAATVVYWFAWTAFHPETGLWNGLEGDEASPTRAKDVEISDLEGYWSTLLALVADDSSENRHTPASLYVIKGNLKNTSTHPIHHAELRFELLDSNGAVVYREIGFNRSAEALRPPVAGEPKVNPILPGATDSFRMLLFGDELPEFTDIRVEVVQIE